MSMSRRRRQQKKLPPALAIVMTVALLLAGAFLYQKAEKTFENAAYPLTYRDIAEKYAAEYDLAPSLVMAVIRTESGFDPTARSGAGALGLMQLTESTFEWAQWREKVAEPLSFNQLTDPDINIHYGCATLSLLKGLFEDEQTALAAYNAGMGNARKWLEDPQYSDDGVTLKQIPFKETREYVKKVTEAQEKYRALYNMA